MAINHIMVIGAGTMGNGIAHVFAQAGYSVTLSDIDEQHLEQGLATITRNLDRQVKKGTIKAKDKKETLERIHLSTDMKASAPECELIVEAATENYGVKAEIFRTIDHRAKKAAILASNTSSISITRLAGITERPDKVIGMHFFNPVPMMKLVEIVRGVDTSSKTFKTIHELTLKLGKSPVEVNDSAGFVSNRILMPMINEAVFALSENVASVEDIDEVMKLGMAHPMGPLQLADFIGLDVCLFIMETLQADLGDDKYRPCPLLRRMVDANHLGRKTGKGFYTYDK
jgi:3-hydroxybutyryl-CoA dehydrogenase